MKNHKIFLWLGIIIFAMPFLGIRQSYKNSILFIAGLTLITIAIIVRNQVRAVQYESSERVFVENESIAQAAPFEDVSVENDLDESPVVAYTDDTSITSEQTPADMLYEEIARMAERDDVHDADEDVARAIQAVEEKLEPITKPRKKRTTKKPTIREEMDEPVIITDDVASIIEDIDQTFDVDKE